MADEKFVPAFEIEDIRRWETELLTAKVPSLSNTDLTMLPHITGMIFGRTPYGLAIRYVTDAGTTADIMLNPVAAHALVQSIMGHGHDAGWVAPDGKLSIPQVPPKMKRRT
ncbi:hypothetical protein [Limimaricola sp.]|uniref:hypothetical protein n=1 Tax=Limimaricola sp. TaxID=2211665 RepID=UPI00405A0278